MEAHRTPGDPCRWRRHVFPLILSLSGVALILSALHYRQPTPPIPSSRQIAQAASGRGSRLSDHRWYQLEEQALEIEFSSTGPAWEAGTPASPSWMLPIAGPRGTGGLALEELLSPEPTPTPPRREVITYTVQKGDNVYLISQKFGVSLDTIIWANGRLELDPDLLSIGQQLAILPVSGVWHTVKAGETLASIARRYQVTPEDILNYEPNGLEEPVSLTPGQKLIIPGGEKPFEPYLVYTEAGAVTVNARPEPGRFIWPCSGAITQKFHSRHLAIDIGNVAGTPIYAADSGTVTLAGWYGGMGNTVRISHAKGYVTYYGHMQRIMVSQGDWVQRGQQIGEMGSTGQSTGPHLHFVIVLQGGAVNPVRYLPWQ
ncbi:MAG: LysM peptidoglycan-binding domain-containing M23 family metallopeptidase [Anaerolineae bacterium]|nr:LysM peptidoglycan-binding domain-containing M23 family metallopeptidase [Anaerolineae bacterium]